MATFNIGTSIDENYVDVINKDVILPMVYKQFGDRVVKTEENKQFYAAMGLGFSSLSRIKSSVENYGGEITHNYFRPFNVRIEKNFHKSTSIGAHGYFSGKYKNLFGLGIGNKINVIDDDLYALRFAIASDYTFVKSTYGITSHVPSVMGVFSKYIINEVLLYFGGGYQWVVTKVDNNYSSTSENEKFISGYKKFCIGLSSDIQGVNLTLDWRYSGAMILSILIGVEL